MSIINSQPLIGASGSSGYQISRSVRIRTSASAYFNRTPGSASNRQKFTWSGWVKRGTLSTTQAIFNAGTSATDRTMLLIEPTNEFRFYSTNGGTGQGDVKTTAVFRDASAWYHVVFAVDTTQATAGNRLKIYVNGVLQALTTTTTMTLNAQTYINNTVAHVIGKESYTGSNYFDGYLTEINFIDGQQLDSSSFGETNYITGVWSPKKYNSTYGTNGYYLNFSDNSNNTATTIGKDSSGNGNNYTPNNISVTSGATYDSMLDVPTLLADGGNGRGNYATLNPNYPIGSTAVLSNGNLQSTTGTTGLRTKPSTIAVSSGKWYWEVTPTANSGGADYCIGIGATGYTADTGALGRTATEYSYVQNGNKFNNNTAAAYGATYTTNDVIGVALDLDNGTLTFYKNNTSQGVAYSSLSGEFFALASDGSSAQTSTFVFNFGQRPFSYTPPTGYLALNTQNLPDPTIRKGNQYFDVSLWTGTGATQSIVNSGSMQPDLVWIKQRSAIRSHRVHDSIRGVNKQLFPDTSGAETSNTDELTAFNSDGFTLSTSAGVNASAGTYVGLQWKESATSGLDIVAYTGSGANRTIAHNLGVTPSMIFIKDRTSATGGAVYHSTFGATKYLKLFQATTGSDAAVTDNTVWNGGSPTINGSVFSVGTSSRTNTNTDNYIAYLFAGVAGFSKFDSYVGNGSADGPFIYLGFRPKFIMIKNITTTGTAWNILDSSRNTYNVVTNALFPDLSDAEVSNRLIDFLSNGIKIRQTTANTSGDTFIYAAFAENPFKYSLAR